MCQTFCTGIKLTKTVTAPALPELKSLDRLPRVQWLKKKKHRLIVVSSYVPGGLLW